MGDCNRFEWLLTEGRAFWVPPVIEYTPRMKLAATLAIVVILLASAWTFVQPQADLFARTTRLLASVFFVDSSTPESLMRVFRDAHASGRKVNILIVPGHDNQYSGAAYGGIREADLTLALGKMLLFLFKNDPYIQAEITRDELGYTPQFASYFKNERERIIAFRDAQMSLMRTYVADGLIETNTIVSHNTAASEVSIRLYGINKWANEHNMDIVLHIHFNDNPRTNRNKPGAYRGFSIYVPERQYSNAKGSKVLADALKKRLGEHYSASSMPLEKVGVIEDQELIAIGSNNSLDSAVVLTEYAYIYEPPIQKKETRNYALAVFALQTYFAVQDLFSGNAYGR